MTTQNTDTNTAKQAHKPPGRATNSDEGGAEVDQQDALPEVLGQSPERPTTDRVQPRPEAVEAAAARRVSNQRRTPANLG